MLRSGVWSGLQASVICGDERSCRIGEGSLRPVFEIPPLDQLALGGLVVGVLFVLRLVLAVRRLREEADGRAGFSAQDLKRVRQAGSYGADLEPNRRYALRQLLSAALFLAVGLVLAAWLAVAHFVGPIGLGGLSA